MKGKLGAVLVETGALAGAELDGPVEAGIEKFKVSGTLDRLET